MDRSLGLDTGSTEAESWPREAANLGLFLLKIGISFVLVFVLMLGQILLWIYLLKIPAGLLAWNFDASGAYLVAMVFGQLMVLVPWLRAVVPAARGMGQGRYPLPGPNIIQRTASSRTTGPSADG